MINKLLQSSLLLLVFIAPQPTLAATQPNPPAPQQGATAPAQINQAMIDQMEATVVQAIATKNLRAIANLMSADIIITLEVNGIITTMDKQHYLEYIHNGWVSIAHYHYAARNQVVTIDSPTRAIVTRDVMETIIANGQAFKANTEEESIVELHHGKPLITKITGHMSLTSSVDL